MGKSTIKQLAETVQYTSSTILYRIGNLRILQISGTPPHGTILYEQDRPKQYLRSPAICNDTGGNLYCAIGNVNINTNGVINCAVATAYYSAGTGYSTFTNGIICASLIWTV